MEKSYNDKQHTWGRAWIAAGLVLFLGYLVALSCALGVWPNAGKFFAGFLPTMAIFGPAGIIEFFTYAPMLGTSGLYCGFLTGNLSNLKVPCALNALNTTDTQASTEEGEIVSAVAVCVSSMVTIVILAVGILCFSFVTDTLDSPALAPAFANILPALFGGLGLVYISKSPKVAAVPVIFMLLLYFAMPTLPVSILVPVGAAVAIAWARWLYVKKKI
ncbi:MAG: hypothetical protein VB092_05175 [Oscillospiraceae bacterium]|nr:hypothetical protein [Oscillospiraceae bacterium]